MKFILAYIAVLVVLIVLDALWLGLISRSFLKEHIGHLFRAKFVWWAIGLFYLLYAGAIVYFAVLPAGGIWTKALLIGAFLGFTAYMTYDLVNFATLKDWPIKVVIIDILWGSFMTACASATAVLIAKL